MICFSLGAIFMLITVLLFFVFAPTDNLPDQVGWVSFFGGEDVYIFTFILIWIVFATAVNIQIFRSYSINYTFIFEID